MKAVKMELDANKKEKYYYQNKYLSLVSIPADTVIQYKYNAVIDVAEYEKKDGLFGKKKRFIDISSPDPNFKINGVERFRKEITVPVKRWGVGLQGGYYFIPRLGRFEPGVGIGLSYNIFRF